jgi:hypothetical protein
MRSLSRGLRAFIPALAIIATSLAAGSGTAAAYGSADQPLAQLEFSGNCNNPSFPLCDPQTGVGLGGIWLWVEVDANNTGDIAGAGCGHVRGSGGGAGSIKGDVTWVYGNEAAAIAAHAFILGADPTHTYYIVTVGPGEAFAWPVTVGHYSLHPVPAVALEVQTAP